MVAGLAVLCLVVAAIGWGAAAAQDDHLTGRSVSDAEAAALRTAARSCPVLTPARLAGQLMAESGLDARANPTKSGGEGIAGLNAGAWKKWAPWPGAERSDSAANITALAHLMCDLSGQLRVAEIEGDPWRLSLAAFHIGLDEVRTKKKVPSAAFEYVEQSSGYAVFYGGLAALGVAGAAESSRAQPQPKAVPVKYIELVLQAGKTCKAISPAAVAAQLMAQSGFDANKLGDRDERGIAQMLPEVWHAHGPAQSSPWAPEVAIPALGAAMCALNEEFKGMEGDPYLLALSAYRNGPTAVRQARGDLDHETEAFLRTVRQFTDFYALDGRLKPESPSTKPTVTSPPSSTSPGGGKQPKAKPTPKPTLPAGKPITRPANTIQLFNEQLGLCVSTGAGRGGTPLSLQQCHEDKSQWLSYGSDGTMRSQGLCVEVARSETKDGTPVQLAACTGSLAQEWKWNSSGRSLMSGLVPTSCLDHHGFEVGAPLNIWYCVSNKKQTWAVR
ncbi:ricin-type beta-trefoil lectin domain protein [Micromonospora chokoriensis]